MHYTKCPNSSDGVGVGGDNMEYVNVSRSFAYERSYKLTYINTIVKCSGRVGCVFLPLSMLRKTLSE